MSNRLNFWVPSRGGPRIAWPSIHQRRSGRSAAQVFDHLQRTEYEILEAARAGLSQPDQIGMRDRLAYIFLNKVFNSNRKVKIPPSVKTIFPDADPRMPEVLACWRQTRDALRSFYHSLEPAQRKAGIFRHPVAGWMNIAGIVGFFSVHMRHHAFQLVRIRSASAHVPHT